MQISVSTRKWEEINRKVGTLVKNWVWRAFPIFRLSFFFCFLGEAKPVFFQFVAMSGRRPEIPVLVGGQDPNSCACDRPPMAQSSQLQLTHEHKQMTLMSSWSCVLRFEPQSPKSENIKVRLLWGFRQFQKEHQKVRQTALFAHLLCTFCAKRAVLRTFWCSF